VTSAKRVGSVRGTSFVDTTAASGARYTYVVTALDQLWSESPAGPPRFVF
jgi:hypothetical protein